MPQSKPYSTQRQSAAEPQSKLSLSVIVPIYNEEESIPTFLDGAVQWDCVDEIIFVDGGSTDSTRAMLEGLNVLQGPKGRGIQCRLGAAHAKGDALVFLHADSYVPGASMRAIYEALVSGVRWGCLTLRFINSGPHLMVGHLGSNARVRLTGVPFGDQTIFVTREMYDAVGGIPDLPIMEDYEFSRRLKALCWPRQLSAKVYTSPRRFHSGGTIRTMFKMRYLRHLYRKGVPIGEIARMYGEGRCAHG